MLAVTRIWKRMIERGCPDPSCCAGATCGSEIVEELLEQPMAAFKPPVIRRGERRSRVVTRCGTCSSGAMMQRLAPPTLRSRAIAVALGATILATPVSRRRRRTCSSDRARASPSRDGRSSGPLSAEARRWPALSRSAAATSVDARERSVPRQLARDGSGNGAARAHRAVRRRATSRRDLRRGFDRERGPRTMSGRSTDG